jgi:hypothetical protein
MRETLQVAAGPRLQLELEMAGSPALAAVERNQAESILLDVVASIRASSPINGPLRIRVSAAGRIRTQAPVLQVAEEYVTVTFRYAAPARQALPPKTGSRLSSSDAERLALARVYDKINAVQGAIEMVVEDIVTAVTVFLPADIAGASRRQGAPQRRLESGSSQMLDTRRAVDAALRILAAYSKRVPWDAEDEVVVRRWTHDLRSSLELVAFAVLERVFMLGFPNPPDDTPVQ